MAVSDAAALTYHYSNFQNPNTQSKYSFQLSNRSIAGPSLHGMLHKQNVSFPKFSISYQLSIPYLSMAMNSIMLVIYQIICYIYIKENYTAIMLLFYCPKSEPHIFSHMTENS